MAGDPVVRRVAPFDVRSADEMGNPVRMGIIVALLLIWLVITVLGFVIKGIFWLAVIGIVLFLATIAYGFVKGLFKSGTSR